MLEYHSAVIKTTGAAVPNASVTVYLVGTLDKATIYSDEGITPIANPLTTDSNGRFSFYVANGDYDIEISGSGIVTYKLTDVTIVDTKTAAEETHTHSNKSILDAIQQAFTTTLKNKLDGIEDVATADQTAAEIRDLLAGLTGEDRLALDKIKETATYKYFTATLLTKLDGIEEGANNYSLPTASDTVKGGIKVGDRLSIVAEVLSAIVQSDNNLTDALKAAYDDAVVHKGLTNNPHSVTKTQVSLGNVTDEAQIAKSIGTTKGDIIGFTGAGAPTRRGVGSNGQVLTADSTETDGIKWATPFNKFRVGLLPAGANLTGRVTEPELSQVQGTNFDYDKLLYDKDTDEYCYYVIPASVLKDYGGGAISINIKAKANATAGDVIFFVQLLGRTNNEAWDSAMEAAQTFTAVTVPGTANQLFTVTKSFTPSAAEFTAGDVLLLKVARKATDAGDTLAVDCEILSVEIVEN